MLIGRHLGLPCPGVCNTHGDSLQCPAVCNTYGDSLQCPAVCNTYGDSLQCPVEQVISFGKVKFKNFDNSQCCGVAVAGRLFGW